MPLIVESACQVRERYAPSSARANLAYAFILASTIFILTGSFQLTVSVLSKEDSLIATKSYVLSVALPLQLFGENLITSECPKDVVDGELLSCKATVPSGTDLRAILSFGRSLHVGTYSFADTEISYIGSSWDESTPKASGHHSQNYVKVLTTVQDTEALLIAADVETELPNTELQFVVMQTNTNEEKCKEQHSSVTRGVSCTHPGRYSFAKRACVGEPSEPDLQIPSDHTHESFSSSFPSVGSQRVYFDEPILLKKGDILGVSVIKGRIAATVNDENPDCVLSVDSTLCSNQGIEARARFMVLGSSKVMVKALTPPDVTEDITVEWHFENDLGTAQVEGTLEYLQPVENIEITGEDTPLVSEGQEYRVNFTGHADSIHWSFGDGEELKTDGCSTNVTKAWWWPGTYNLTVTVSNRISTMEFTMTIRVGLLPAIDFYVWTYEVPRGELAVLGFENGLVNKDGVFSSQRDDFMVCYVSSSITGHTSINMTSASGPNIWVPTSNLYDQYIKFYYQELSYISGIKTAGHPELEQWVEEFKLYYHIRWGIWKPLLKLDGSDLRCSVVGCIAFSSTFSPLSVFSWQGYLLCMVPLSVFGGRAGVVYVEFVFVAALRYEFRAFVQEGLFVCIDDAEFFCETELASLRLVAVGFCSAGDRPIDEEWLVVLLQLPDLL
ncbi:hypothetical protein BSL78_22365 [Apostichopus japonicus]|uniref:PKD domain-containing protein n=1 Tax=Stichopus japonicus TaxID=307972 RepID=A0A2G8JYL6_STIJA|nr:hypothetical protein BSL78_22365 [Apostichopus japonicus]